MVETPVAVAAMHYARQLGLEVFPLVPGGKTPITEHGHKDATTNPGQINSWWQARPAANVGAPIPPGLLVLDLDGPEAFHALKAKDFDLPSTVTTKTPRGYHFWFTCKTPCQPKVGILPGVDLRAPGSYVVLPPSRLSNGSKYDWEVLPSDNSFTEAPDWLVELAAPKGLTVTGDSDRLSAAEVLSGVPKGSRDQTLFRYACSLRARGVRREEAELLVTHAASSCSPPFPRPQALRKVSQAWKYEGPEEKAPEGSGRVWNVKELLETELPEPAWLLPPILMEGLSILVAPPKVGKSFLMGSICSAIAKGGTCLGALQSSQAGVLYLDLEQTEHQAKSRWLRILDGEQPDDRLFTAFEWPRMRSGGLEQLDGFLDQHAEVRLVVIDILSRFWPDRAKNDGHNAYHWESAVLGEMKKLAEKKGIALVLVHHTNRSSPTDPLDKVSGTNAMTGVPGAILVLNRDRGSSDGKLYVTGRSVEEQTIEMSFNPFLRGWCAKDPMLGALSRMPV